MNLIKSTIKNISIRKDETERRAKEIMAHFDESESELRAITRCSNILKEVIILHLLLRCMWL